MKLVKNAKFGSITTTIDGVLYIITEDGIQVSDEVASKMKEQFLHTIDVEELAPVEEPQSSVDEDNQE